MGERADAIQVFFNDLRLDTMRLVDVFYAENARFEGPVVTVDGQGAIKRYYQGMYENVVDIRFDFADIIEEPGKAAAVWRMHLQARSLNGGRPIDVPGISHFHFDEIGQATYHRDYFDMGAFIYEYVPVVRTAIGYIKGRVARGH